MKDIVPIDNFETLTNREKASHLKFIADFARSILTNFYEKDEMAESQALEIESWQRVLCVYSSEEMIKAWADERAQQVSDHGRLKYRVVPEVISAHIRRARPKPKIVPKEEPKSSQRSDADRAAMFERLSKEFPMLKNLNKI